MALPAPVRSGIIQPQATYHQATYLSRIARPSVYIQPFPDYGTDISAIFRYDVRGAVPGGLRIKGSIPVTVVFDPEEVIVAESKFHMHASAPSFPEAVQAFRETLADYVELLEERRDTLGVALRDQLAYLHSVLEAA